MKNLPTYNEFLNEGSKKYKDFKDVKSGDKGEDYIGEPGTVLGTAVGEKGYKSKLKKWDESGSMSDVFDSPDDYDYTKEDLDSLEMIAIRDDSGESSVFTYGPDGFIVYK